MVIKVFYPLVNVEKIASVILLVSVFLFFTFHPAHAYLEWGSLGSGDGQFNLPSGITTDSSGNVYVLDQFNHRVQKFTSDGTFVTKWGSAGSDDGKFRFPRFGIAIDSSDNVYVTDTQNHRIQKFTSDGKFITKWGGHCNVETQEGDCASHNQLILGDFYPGFGKFDMPSGIAIDNKDNVYVADTGNNRIQIFTSDGIYLDTLGDDESYKFIGPHGIEVDSKGDLYVSHVPSIQKISNGNSIDLGSFGQVWDIAIDRNSMIAIPSLAFDNIQTMDLNGNRYTKCGSKGTGFNQFEAPSGISFGSNGIMYVVDRNNHRIVQTHIQECANSGATIELDQKIYSWTDKVHVTIVAPDHDVSNYLIDEIGETNLDGLLINTRNFDLHNYKLVETGTNTGIFTGEVTLTGFSSHDADGDGMQGDARGITGDGSGTTRGLGPTDGFLSSNGDDDGIAVSFEFSEDETVVGTALIRWNVGEVQWLPANYPVIGSGVVRVIEPDLNLDPEKIDNFEIDVWSDSDLGGIDLTVTEINESSGIFEGTVLFTISEESSGNRLRVTQGDAITAEYEDNTLPHPSTPADELDIIASSMYGTFIDNPPWFPDPPQDIQEVTDDPSGKQIFYPLPVAKDNEGPASVSCKLPSGSHFSLGSTQVTCTATDTAGSSVTVPFTVTVIYQPAVDLPPWFPDPPQDIQEVTDDPSGKQIFYPLPVAKDNEGPASVSCKLPSGSHFSLGSTPVTCTATDTAGKSEVALFLVTIVYQSSVIDKEPPFFPDPPQDIQKITDDSTGAIVTYDLPIAKDDVKVENVVCIPFSGLKFPVSSTLVTCTATDTSGKTTKTGFTVTVIYEPKIIDVPHQEDSAAIITSDRNITANLIFIESSDFRTLAFNELPGKPGNNPTINANVGDEIIFNVENGGRSFHSFGVTANAEGNGNIFPSSEVASPSNPLKPGESGSSKWIANDEGVFYYICTVPGHREQGMVGKIIVSGQEDGTAATDPGPTCGSGMILKDGICQEIEISSSGPDLDPTTAVIIGGGAAAAAGVGIAAAKGVFSGAAAVKGTAVGTSTSTSTSSSATSGSQTRIQTGKESVETQGKEEDEIIRRTKVRPSISFKFEAGLE